MTTPTLFTLPPHVRITIAELVATDAAPTALRDDLSAALTAAERDREDNDADDVDASDAAGGVAPTSLDPALATGSIETLGAPSPDTNTDAAVIDIESSDTEPEKPERRPETIDADLIDRLGSWAAANPDALSEAGLDPNAYSLIALLAGAKVWMPAKQAAMLLAAEKASEEPSPYIPTYLSPAPPSIGKEYRSLARQLSTALNVLFSIFGCGGAVWVVAKNAGFRAEQSLLLAILTGVVVGAADVGLIVIFKDRLTRGRKEAREKSRRINTGKATDAVPVQERLLVEGGEVNEKAEDGEGPVDDMPAAAPRTIQLRRRALPSKD